GIDRAAVNERWRVARVQAPLHARFAMTPATRKAFLEKAEARLEGLWKSLATPAGRADAGASAAELQGERGEMTAAVALAEAVRAQSPDSEAQMRCRRTRHQVLDKELSLAAHITRLPATQALKVRARNLGTLFLRAYRVTPRDDVPSDDFWSNYLARPREEWITKWVSGHKPVAEWKVALHDPGDHRFFERDLDAPVRELGLYLVVAAEDAGFRLRQSVVEGAFLNVTDLAIVRADGTQAVRYYAFDAKTGGPAAGARIHLKVMRDWRNRKTDQLTADRDGVASYKLPGEGTLQLDALAEQGAALAYFDGPSWHSAPGKEPPLSLFLATDRPIYRPSQELKLRVTSIARAGDGSYRIDSGRHLTVALRDPNGREVAVQKLITGPLGSVATSFALPGKGLLGQFQIVATADGVRDVQHWLPIAVEEDKRPEFEGTLEPPKGAGRYGQAAKLAGSVKYYFGGVAPDVPVRFKVFRRRWIPWWMWRRGESPRVEIARGEVKTGKDGKFEVPFVPERDPTLLSDPDADPDMPDISDFEVQVEAHDSGGRTIAAQKTMRVGAQALLLAADSERGFFFSNEPATLRARLVNLEESAVSGQASWELARLHAPSQHDKPPKPRGEDSGKLPRVLRACPVEKKVAAGQVAFAEGKPAALALPVLPAGGYRVTLEAKDPWGATVKGMFHFLVADAASKSLD